MLKAFMDGYISNWLGNVEHHVTGRCCGAAARFQGQINHDLAAFTLKGSRMELALTLNHKGLQERLILILRQ